MLNKLLHSLAQNLNTLQKNLPTSQYELGIKCPHAERLAALFVLPIMIILSAYPTKYSDM
jgi:hypothetical protein